MESSPIGRLPGELRNRVYKLILRRSVPIETHMKGGKMVECPKHHFKKDLRTLAEQQRETSRDAISLMSLSRQIRAETQGFYFQLNRLKIYADTDLDRFYPALLEWSQSVGGPTMTKSIRSVIVVIKPTFLIFYQHPDTIEQNLLQWREQLRRARKLFHPAVSFDVGFGLRPYHRHLNVLSHDRFRLCDAFFPFEDPERARKLFNRWSREVVSSLGTGSLFRSYLWFRVFRYCIKLVGIALDAEIKLHYEFSSKFGFVLI